jgi:reverse gyrase
MIALRSEKDKQKGGIGVESVRRVRERWIDFTEEKGNDRREMGHGYGE